MQCQHCHTTIDGQASLCPECELAFAFALLRLAVWLDPLRASLDATIHPGGHQPTRVVPPVAPTPIRLNVLDLLDTLDADSRELWRRLEGVDALDWTKDRKPDRSLKRLLVDIAAHPQLPLLADAGMWMRGITRLERQTLAIIDIPDRPKPIGHCPNSLCGIPLSAADGQTMVACPVCGGEWKVSEVRFNLFLGLTHSDRLMSLTDGTRLLNQCGYRVTRKQLAHRRDRGQLTPQAHDSKHRQLFRIRDLIATLRDD